LRYRGEIRVLGAHTSGIGESQNNLKWENEDATIHRKTGRKQNPGFKANVDVKVQGANRSSECCTTQSEWDNRTLSIGVESCNRRRHRESSRDHALCQMSKSKAGPKEKAGRENIVGSDKYWKGYSCGNYV
jgi:hypothetical protein